jgi:hypothetical protein
VAETRSPAAILICSRTMSRPVQSSETGCVQLDEVEVALRAEQKFERARVLVADRRARAGGCHLHLLTGPLGERGGRRFLDQLLMTALNGAFAFAQGENSPVGVAQHLHLHMAGGNEGLLQVDALVAEGRSRLGRRVSKGRLELVRGGDEPHALAAAAGRCLQEHGVADVVRRLAGLRRGRELIRARHGGHVRRSHLLLGLDLVPHARHDVGARADEDEVVLVGRAHEGGILGQEAPAGVDRLAPGRPGGGDQRRDPEVALRRGGRPDPHGPVGHAHVHRVLVSRRIHSHGLDAHVVECANDADGHLAAVGYENPGEHQWSARCR